MGNKAIAAKVSALAKALGELAVEVEQQSSTPPARRVIKERRKLDVAAMFERYNKKKPQR